LYDPEYEIRWVVEILNITKISIDSNVNNNQVEYKLSEIDPATVKDFYEAIDRSFGPSEYYDYWREESIIKYSEYIEKLKH